ncbi:MAG: hypothetical protein WKF37_09630 [Bryobacteraceae bacterium]
MIKTIIFDLGKVIIPFDFQRGYDRLAPLCAYPAIDIPERLRGGDLVTRFETGLIGPEDFVKEISSTLDLKIEYAGFCDIWSVSSRRKPSSLKRYWLACGKITACCCFPIPTRSTSRWSIKPILYLGTSITRSCHTK